MSDYFSVTGGDFTVEASGKGSFRINNFDDGSNVEVLTGHASVLHQKETTQLSKGMSLSMKAGENSVSLGQLSANDEFDRWVSGRIDTVSTRNERFAAVYELSLLPTWLRRSLHLWLLVFLRGVRIRLAAFRR